MTKVAIIPADLSEPVRFDDVDVNLDFIYAHVHGGPFDVALGNISVYVNDTTGLLDELPINTRASALRDSKLGEMSEYPLCGDALVTGEVDADGNDTDLPDGVESELRSLEQLIGGILPHIEQAVFAAAQAVVADKARWN